MLMSELPVVEAMYHLVFEEDYWFLRETHRHQGGRFGDCPAINYPRLTVDELSDVMCSSYDDLIESSEPEESDPLDEEPF